MPSSVQQSRQARLMYPPPLSVRTRSTPHAVVGEPSHGSTQEASAVLGVFDRQDLAIGNAAVRVDHAVHVVVTHMLALAVTRLEAMRAPAATTRYPTELFRIDVHEFTRP